MGMPARSIIPDDATEGVARTLMAFYKAKHPEYANDDKIRRITDSFKQKAESAGGQVSWQSLMWAEFERQGANPREFAKEGDGVEQTPPQADEGEPPPPQLHSMSEGVPTMQPDDDPEQEEKEEDDDEEGSDDDLPDLDDITPEPAPEPEPAPGPAPEAVPAPAPERAVGSPRSPPAQFRCTRLRCTMQWKVGLHRLVAL